MKGGLTDVPGITVGHATDTRALTGCTVVLCESGAIGGIEIRGWATGVAGLDLLDPRHFVESIHAVCLAGGSAFGLEAVFGVKQFLEEKGIGLPVANTVVPLVAGAILFDLTVGDGRVRPDKAMGYQACLNATAGKVPEGSVGAGTGATVGKLHGIASAMKGGIGSASVKIGRVVVAALVAINAFGDVVDPRTRKILAGARTSPSGRTFVDTAEALKKGARPPGYQRGANTTIGVVATNARLSKVQAGKVAGWAHLGLARTISPVHTTVDGDTLFCLSTGHQPAHLDVVGQAAAGVVAEASVRAVMSARGAGGVPARRDLSRLLP